VTDPTGRYLFRDLAPGSYSIKVQHEGQTSTRTVLLGAQPVDLKDEDFQMSRPSPPDTPPPAAVLPAMLRLGSRSATAQQHNILGRQLTQSGQYREAIVELTEALRIAPNFALAFNARAFAFVMLHDWGRAIEDLDQAILLNPSYQNAYQIRAIARRAVGDTDGAADDLRKSKQLAEDKSAGPSPSHPPKASASAP
jgi:tetratricopeptide (TPR) repeat protein